MRRFRLQQRRSDEDGADERSQRHSPKNGHHANTETFSQTAIGLHDAALRLIEACGGLRARRIRHRCHRRYILLQPSSHYKAAAQPLGRRCHQRVQDRGDRALRSFRTTDDLADVFC